MTCLNINQVGEKPGSMDLLPFLLVSLSTNIPITKSAHPISVEAFLMCCYLIFTTTLGLREIFVQQAGPHQPLCSTGNDLWRVHYSSFWKTCPYYFLTITCTVEVVKSSEKEVHIIVFVLNVIFAEYPALEQVLSFFQSILKPQILSWIELGRGE